MIIDNINHYKHLSILSHTHTHTTICCFYVKMFDVDYLFQNEKNDIRKFAYIHTNADKCMYVLACIYIIYVCKYVLVLDLSFLNSNERCIDAYIRTPRCNMYKLNLFQNEVEFIEDQTINTYVGNFFFFLWEKHTIMLLACKTHCYNFLAFSTYVGMYNDFLQSH